MPKDKPPHPENTENAGGENSSKSDSKPDKDMVFWTRAVGIFTALLVVSSVLQYCTMQGQLDEMRSGAKQTDSLIAATQTQANASQQQIGILQGQLTTMAQQAADTKAYIEANIGFQGVNITPINPENINYGLYINPIWKNIGGTNANDFIDWFDWNLIKASVFSQTCPAAPEPKKKLGNPIVISPGETIVESAAEMPFAAFKVAQSNSNVFIIYGQIHYRDIFPEDLPKVIKWCVWATPNGDGKSFSIHNIEDEVSPD